MGPRCMVHCSRFFLPWSEVPAGECAPRAHWGGCSPEGKKKWVSCAQIKHFLPLLLTQLRLHSKHMFKAQMSLSNGKTHLERLKWLWERIHIQESIQNGGHKSALWVLDTAEEEFRLSPFLCSCSMLGNDWKKSLPTEISSKVSMVPKLRGWQRNQQNPTKKKKTTSCYFSEQF